VVSEQPPLEWKIEAITRFWNKKIRWLNKEGPPPGRIVAMLATSMPHDATFVDKKINRDPISYQTNQTKKIDKPEALGKKGMSHRAGDLRSREPISKSAITGLSVRRPVRRAGTSPVESLRHRGGMRDEPFVPFTELEFFRDVSLVFGLELDY
jgi:hypothetical protein